MVTPLTQLLGIRRPVVLAPMGHVAGGALAAEVSRAGGLGLVGAGYGDCAWLERELERIGDARPFGVGFITWSIARDPSALDLALSYRPDVLMFSFGEDRAYIRQAHDGGAHVMCQVQTVDDARRARDEGADVIVAQGTEAGGHGGGRSLFPLLPAVVDAVSPIPVVAAGGIVDGRGLAGALTLGASGALIGTRFAASREALLSDAAKQRLVEASGEDTVRTRVFDIVRGYAWPAPFTGRALHNDFVTRWHGNEDALRENLAAEQALYRRAHEENDLGTAVVFAGEGVDGIHAVEPAHTLVQRITDEAGACLASAAPSSSVADAR